MEGYDWSTPLLCMITCSASTSSRLYPHRIQVKSAKVLGKNPYGNRLRRNSGHNLFEHRPIISKGVLVPILVVTGFKKQSSSSKPKIILGGVARMASRVSGPKLIDQSGCFYGVFLLTIATGVQPLGWSAFLYTCVAVELKRGSFVHNFRFTRSRNLYIAICVGRTQYTPNGFDRAHKVRAQKAEFSDVHHSCRELHLSVRSTLLGVL